MQKVHKKNIKFKIILIFLILIFVLIFNPYGFFSPVRNFVHTIFMPVIQLGYFGGDNFRETFETIKSIGSLSEKNQKLYQENISLQSKITELKDVSNENDILRNELDILSRDELKLIGAEVIMRDVLGNNDWIEINRGSSDGLEKGDSVIVGEKNLIGLVEEVFSNQARVNLINHPDSLINVVTVESDVEAIASGKHGISVIAEKIDQDVEVENGMTFITSQISGEFPRGLTVGVVQDVYPTYDGLFKNARIMPLVDLDKIKFVFVVVE